MKKYYRTFLSVSLLSVFFAMFLVTCGGGGGGGDGGGDRGDLTGLSINGPSSVAENRSATYTATAAWSNGSSSSVTPTWSVNPQVASISPGGLLSCSPVDTDMTVTVTATYSSGGITETASMDVTILDIASIPCTAQMISGKVFYQENVFPGGGSNSNLFYFNSDSTFLQDWYEFDGIDESDGRLTGTWSIDASGNLIVNIGGQGTATVTCLVESDAELQISVDDGAGTPTTETLEKTVPVDPAKLPGTYIQSQEGYTWVFNSNGTGTISGFGGLTFTWSVDAGVLKMPSSTGYSAWCYARAGSQSTPSAYTVLKVGFPEYGPGGVFYKYYGGKDLTRQ